MARVRLLPALAVVSVSLGGCFLPSGPPPVPPSPASLSVTIDPAAITIPPAPDGTGSVTATVTNTGETPTDGGLVVTIGFLPLGIAASMNEPTTPANCLNAPLAAGTSCSVPIAFTSSFVEVTAFPVTVTAAAGTASGTGTFEITQEPQPAT